MSIDETILRAPEWMSTSQELRWVAKRIQTGKFMIGMGRMANVMRAFQIEFMSDDSYECEAYLDSFHESESQLTMQVLLLCFAADLIEDHCQCCGRPYR